MHGIDVFMVAETKFNNFVPVLHFDVEGFKFYLDKIEIKTAEASFHLLLGTS